MLNQQRHKAGEQTRNCAVKDGSFLSHLSSTAVEDFEAVKVDLVYPTSSALFLEGHEPRGVFLLLEGLAKLSTGSSDGRTLILRIASPGEVLGLAAVLSGDPYEVTAEALHPCQVAFLRRNDFLRFVREHPEALPRSNPAPNCELQRYVRTAQDSRPFTHSARKTRKATARMVGHRPTDERRHPHHIVLDP